MKAAIPVLKIEAFPKNKEKLAKNDFTFVKVDIVVDLQENLNIKSTSFRTTEYVKMCIEKYPSFKSIIILLKYVLSLQGLNNSYTGGLNAYGLGILYEAFLI